ncbi:homeobox-leucine zipper protein HAT14-like [Bidens hawaiensis]|uniref:homeobox-leucine zipper protein HAT14-like n=1 Tax=Bidens hawaiensis TaxID=980011 RepID=UPI004049E3B2
MELALSLGDHPPKPFSLLDHHNNSTPQNILDFGFCMGTALETTKNHLQNNINNNNHKTLVSSPDQPPPPPSPPLQLDLLPFSPVLRSPPPQQPPSHRCIPWLTNMVDVKVKPLPVLSDQETGEEPVAGKCSPNESDTSSFQMDFSSVFNGVRSFGSRKHVINHLELIDVKERGCSRGSGGGGMSDDDENGLTRKKLRLTKEQSSFLEDSFKEHNTLNPKQKQALAKQLNLRPRQVEVWFQNRRARTKLKQTEVDCEYLKRCCDTLTEENRKLQKELQELRALKTSQPFYMQRPATTLTMCPSCERVATSTTTTAAAASPSQQPPATTASHIH